MYSAFFIDMPHRWIVRVSTLLSDSAVMSPIDSAMRCMIVANALPDICWATMLPTTPEKRSPSTSNLTCPIRSMTAPSFRSFALRYSTSFFPYLKFMTLFASWTR